MSEAFLSLYHKRLQNIDAVMKDLHGIVKNDECLISMQDPSLQKYRIDRINEIVSEIMNSEKERLLIKSLEKCTELNKALEEKSSRLNRSNEQEMQIENKKKVDALERILQIKDKQIISLQSELRKSQNNRKKLEISLQKIEEKKICEECEAKEQEIERLENQLNEANRILIKLKNDGEEAVRQLDSKIMTMNKKNTETMSLLEQKSQRIQILENQLLVKNHQHSAKDTSQSLRKQKIQYLKNQIRNLEEQLISVTHGFNRMQQNIIHNFKIEIEQLRISHQSLRVCVEREIKRMKEESVMKIQEMIKMIVEKRDRKIEERSEREQRICWTINQINNQIDYFIENELIS